MDEPLIAGVLDSILMQVEAGLRDPIGRVFIAPGNTVAWDNCCQGGGQLWVRVISMVGAPSMSNPKMQQCVPLFQVRIAVGTIRCVATLDDNGIAPDELAMTTDAKKSYRDMEDILRVLHCDVREIVDSFRIEQWLPSGPEGGCGGGEWTATFNYMPCLDCTDIDIN